LLGVLVAVLLGVLVGAGVLVEVLEEAVLLGVAEGLAELEVALGVADELEDDGLSLCEGDEDCELLSSSDGLDEVSAGPTATIVSNGTLTVSDLMRVELSATPSTKVVL
jgi:hypothetical protein